MDRPRKPPPAPVSRLRGGLQLRNVRNGGRSMKEMNTEPLGWGECFDKNEKVVTERGEEFSYYTSGMSSSASSVLVLLHGGGCTGLSFASISKRLKKYIPIIAIDQREHGETKAKGELKIEILIQDTVDALMSIFKNEKMPNIVLCGHSVGGSVAARVAATEKLPIIATILIDITEGTAIEALPHMNAWVTSRPKSFAKPSDAIRYVCAKGHIRNLESARLSVASQLRFDNNRWIWRTNLESTQSCWIDWFKGLSNIFLNIQGPKLLILAGVDRLDKTLTIGQMQGKFQNILIPDAGHTIHEDQPDKTAAAIIDFLSRNLIIDSSESPANDEQPTVFQQRNPVL